MATEIVGFTSREQRDDLYTQWKTAGSKGLVRYTTHEGDNPQIIWVVARYEKDLTTPQETAIVSQEVGRDSIQPGRESAISEDGNASEGTAPSADSVRNSASDGELPSK